ncbi:hypothetical protein TVAG_332560 [Trichomonas vaginalis G3]|uniref:Uncharacterized protein n=1 Tax=Trichomonas vaginalis (strain ATCC PRA-98 / G3) TaxID=412133 RepID=A2FAC9_TRIV3|nr:hypothetical protein TVAGG3_0916790 [Trichomonas vaginalis G3]EAX98146.1 hypothetical protein TVAG_332560 [Trichomonas vaginalis G3]KAI5484862.1 hypothetical protein TVAGG3_0916790 [Trichomonas vaginalis G3]|eukprot:XP_001311076.1 hypothetical protein [Trichomonas vaginalis G3]
MTDIAKGALSSAAAEALIRAGEWGIHHFFQDAESNDPGPCFPMPPIRIFTPEQIKRMYSKRRQQATASNYPGP